MAKIQWNTKTKPVYPAIQLNIKKLSFLTSEWKWKQEKATKITSHAIETYLLEKYGEKLGEK